MKIDSYLVVSVFAIMLTVIWYFVQRFSSRIIERLDTMVTQNEATGRELVRLTSKQGFTDEKVSVIETRLNDHDGRIKSIEIHNAKCRFPFNPENTDITG